MTCDDIRTLTIKPLETTTRGERAAVMAHMASCPPCREWVVQNEPPGTPGVDYGRLRREDEADPEYCSIVYVALVHAVKAGIFGAGSGLDTGTKNA